MSGDDGRSASFWFFLFFLSFFNGWEFGLIIGERKR